MKFAVLVGLATAISTASAQGLFEGLGEATAQRFSLEKRKVDSCGRPLRADWKPRGAYSKHGGKKRGSGCPANAVSAVKPQKAIEQAPAKHGNHKHKSSHKHKGKKTAPKQKVTTTSETPIHTPSPKAAKVKAAPKVKTTSESVTKSTPTTYAQEETPKAQAKTSSDNDNSIVSKVVSTSTSHGKRGLTWTVNDNLAPVFGAGNQIGWYLHFQDPVVAQMPDDISFVPTLWGGNGDAIAKFQATMAGLDQLPEYMLSFNEPDISSQANMSPQEAASVFKQYLQPYADKGVKVYVVLSAKYPLNNDSGAPSIAWDVSWLQAFFKACDTCTISFLSGHYYVGHSEVALLQSRVNALHTAFPDYKIWVTEYGATTAGGGTAGDILNFAKQTTNWLESQSFIDRVAFYGVYQSAPDGYVNQNCAFLDGAGKLTDIGNWWVHG